MPARKHNLFVIEDNAEAYGGEYKGKKTGSIGDVGCVSFCQNKTFTTGGEGGMVTTDNEEPPGAAAVCDHGYDVRRSSLEMEQKLPYIHTMLGWNYRMTEMQSVIGLCELERIDSWNMPSPPQCRNPDGSPERHPADSLSAGGYPERRNGWYVFP